MPTIVALLVGAFLGVVLLVVLVLMLATTSEPPPPEDDPARPYREALEAAIRIQQTAQETEQRIYAEAAAHMMDGPYEPPEP